MVVTGGWRKLNNLTLSPNIVERKNQGWTDGMISMHGDMGTLKMHRPVAFSSENLKGRDHNLRHFGMDGKIMLKSI